MKPPVEPDDYIGSLAIDGETLSPVVFGLRAGSPPSLRLPGDMSPGSFPRPRRDRAQLVGRLNTNHDILLGDTWTEDWGFTGVGGSAWAIVGLGIAECDAWSEMRVHISGLESLIRRPMAEVSWPKDGRSPRQEYTAIVEPYPISESRTELVNVSPHYDVSFSISDPYQHHITSTAVVTFTAAEPLTPDAWISGWLRPLASLIGVATGRREQLRLVTFGNTIDPGDENRPPDRKTGALFGAGISQHPEPAERQQHESGRPLVPLFTLEASPPLAQLLATWRDVSIDLPALPLLNLSQDRALHPNVRFILLVNAAESLHRHANETDEDEDYQQRRQTLRDIVSRLRHAGWDDDARFLKHHVEARRSWTLQARLQALLDHPCLEPHRDGWTARTGSLSDWLSQTERSPTSVADCLALTRNVLAHGKAHLPPDKLEPAVGLLDVIVRVAILNQLDFSTDQLEQAVEYHASGA